MRKLSLAAVAGLAGVALVGGMLAINLTTAGGEKHVICHFDGQAGTDKFQRIECGSGCVNGHFENDGTPKAGHEKDILDPEGGLCPGEEPGPSPTPAPTALPNL